MQMETPEAPEKVTFERDYPGSASQATRVRADLAEITAGCPAADDLILLASELAANATTHSKSGQPGGKFTVRANLYPRCDGAATSGAQTIPTACSTPGRSTARTFSRSRNA